MFAPEPDMSTRMVPRMPRIKLVTNVSEHGLIRPFALTRGRLVASTAILTTLSIGLGLLSAGWILESSESVVLNLLLITFNMMMMIATAYFQAVLTGDLFFAGPWREQVVLGSTPEEEITVKDHNAEFMIIFLLALLANTLAVNYGSGDFFDQYHNETFFEVRLRSEDPAERKAAFVDLRDPMNFELWQREGLRSLAMKHMNDQSPAVAEEAIWHIGNMKSDAARDELVEIAQDTAREDSVRVEAAHALGKIGDIGESRGALEEVARSDGPVDVRVAALRGLAMLGSPLTVDAVIDLTTHENHDIRTHAYWVLRESADPEIRPMLRERLEAAENQQERCIILDTLKMVATKEDVLWARKEYKKQEAGITCTPIIWEDRNEHQRYVTYSDSMRVKYLKIIANADAKGNLSWFHRLVADPDEEVRVREVANEVLRRFEGTGY